MKKYILVVDDNRIITKWLCRYLELNGYESAAAYDGVECLESIKRRKPDVIIMKIMMPRMDGYECVRQIRKSPDFCGIPITMVTAMNDVANQLKAIENGADLWLSKPIEEQLLIAQVKLMTRVTQ
jgi:CheY-like chemotaxis protein